MKRRKEIVNKSEINGEGGILYKKIYTMEE